MDNQPQELISIIHFNDVYDIQPKGDLAGIVNFKAKVQQLRQKHPNSLLLFSGDCFSPSILSNIFKGDQMVYSLNQLNIDVACFGNHEFDCQYEHTLKMTKKCNFQWLMGNIRFTETNKLLGQGQQYRVVEKGALKIGIFGIAGQDWLGILADFAENQLTYYDHIDHANNMCEYLKKQKHCDIIIALTHMRNTPDLEFPQKVKGVDLVLGGHDHVILEQLVDSCPVIKSGCNFRNIGLIHILKKDQKHHSEDPDLKLGRRFDFNYHVLNVEKASDDKKDKNLEKYVTEKMQAYRNNDQIVGFTQIDLETRFTVHRTHETAYGNFVADLMRLYTESDIGFANSGSIRNDCILPAGPLKYSEVSNIINDALVVKAIPGKVLLHALQYSIEGLPNSYNGSFLHVSGISFKYNSNLPPGSRILEVTLNERQFKLDSVYSVVMNSYISHGGDGFEFFKDLTVLKDQIQTTSLLNLLLKFFNTISEELKTQMQVGQQIQFAEVPLLKKKSSKFHDKITSLQSKLVKGEDGKIYVSIKPKLERRIVDIQQLVKENQQIEQNNEIAQKDPKLQMKSEN